MEKKVKIGVIGLGRISRSHIDGIRSLPDKCDLACVIDVQEPLAQSFSREFGVPYYTSLENALEKCDMDAIVVCLPHNLHEPITVKAANAGKHVLCEKVMATSVREGESMVQAAKANNVKLMIAQSQRFFFGKQEARKRRKEIGKILNMLYIWALYFDENLAPKWWKSKESTGGLIHAMVAPHCLDYTLWMMDDRRVISVYSQGASNKDLFEGDDDATIILGFDDGTHATVYVSINNYPPRHEGLIIGSEGSMCFSHKGDHDGLIGVAETDLYINGKLIMSGEQKPHNFVVQMDEFVNSILEDRTPVPSGEEILLRLKVIEASLISAKEKRVVYLD